MKILLLDLETTPIVSHTWGIWQQNVGINQIVSDPYVLCYAAKWLEDKEVFFRSTQHEAKKTMLQSIWELLDEADAVVHYNGTKFDIPWLNGEFAREGISPPSPYKEIDLLTTVKRRFRFPSNKLEYVVKALGVGKKIKTEGHDLWVGCMAGDKGSWKKMKEYNIQDVAILESLYLNIRPWIKGHANHGLYDTSESQVCPTCGSTDLHKRGTTATLSSIYQRYRCKGCGHWSRGTVILNKKLNKVVSISL